MRFLFIAFLIGLSIISCSSTQHDANTAEQAFAQLNPKIDPNIAMLPMYQTGGQLGSGIVASPRMAAYAMELAQPGSGVRFASRYSGGTGDMAQFNFLDQAEYQYSIR